jgi:hypothetical protein
MKSRRYTVSAKKRLHELVEQVPESEIETAVELLEALVEAPVDPEMLARFDAARRKRGAGIPHEEVLKEFGTLKRFVSRDGGSRRLAAARSGNRHEDTIGIVPISNYRRR